MSRSADGGGSVPPSYSLRWQEILRLEDCPKTVRQMLIDACLQYNFIQHLSGCSMKHRCMTDACMYMHIMYTIHVPAELQFCIKFHTQMM